MPAPLGPPTPKPTQEHYFTPSPLPPPSQVVELGEWVPWEFQGEDQESPSNSDNCDEVVPNPPPGIKAQTTATSDGEGRDGVADKEDGNTTPPSPPPPPLASDGNGSAGPVGNVSRNRHTNFPRSCAVVVLRPPAVVFVWWGPETSRSRLYMALLEECTSK